MSYDQRKGPRNIFCNAVYAVAFANAKFFLLIAFK